MDDNTIRLALQTLLEAAFPDLTIYYRPSGDLELTRPCIVYEAKAIEPSFSNNTLYVAGTRFQVTFLSDLPGYANKRDMFNISGIVISVNRSYVSSDIVHDVFTISVNSIT
jgi:hypothetical protein